ncbi:hypothetical protein [Streptomyces sp. NPDC004728]|uniref:hypothetical protein n=1 Tax=Streptomyces sp. NPDC004728 TaxID=3154289 RepID=UPI0033A0B835
MAGTSGQVSLAASQVEVSPDPCNALTNKPGGLFVPAVEIEAGPGLTVTAPASGGCPATWQIAVDASWAQTASLDFNHALNGADQAWERISEIPPLTIPRAGIWEVDYNVRGFVALPAGTAASEYVSAGIYKNGALIVGTEGLAAGAYGAGITIQGTGGISFLHSFEAGDTMELWAHRIGQTGTAAVMSNPDGRTRLMAHWLAPAGDTP